MSKSKYYLLVDDDEVMTYVNIMTIEIFDPSATIIDFISSTKALRFLKKEFKENNSAPNFIFLDINMPELNGFGFLEKLKPLSEYLSNTQLFILTSSLDKRDKDKALSFPIVKGFLSKPLTTETLEDLFSN